MNSKFTLLEIFVASILSLSLVLSLVYWTSVALVGFKVTGIF